MANRTPEQELIQQFLGHLQQNSDQTLSIDELYNSNSRCKDLADIEYRSKSKLRWVIEAKSHESLDRHNTVHKIFGELLKETGRPNRENCVHAILLPESGLSFYSRAFRRIARDKYISFGKLIPIDTVFLSNAYGMRQITWLELYDAE